MNGELYYVRHPWRVRLFWVILYIVLIGGFIFGIYKIASHIRTHTLPVGQIQLKVPYSKYLLGESPTFTLKNNYNSPIYVVNNCPAEPLAVYRQVSSKWVRIHDQASVGDCPEEQRQVSVPANGVVNGSYAPWHHLFNQPGKYRVVAFVEYYNALPYQEFEVISAPKIQPVAPPASPTQLNLPPAETEGSAPAPYTPKQSTTITTSAGTISVQYDSTTVYVISIAPAAGCTYEGGKSGRQVEITFDCRGTQTQVQLSVVNGQLVKHIETGGD